MDNIIFSHRPIAGVSVGAYSDGQRLYIAASFANDGFSCNGNLREHYVDTFSRRRARQIIAGRIKFARNVFANEPETIPGNRFTFEIETDMTADEFMKSFRQLFKPEVDESDNTLHDVYSEDGTFFERARMRTDHMWDVIGRLATEAMNPAAPVGTTLPAEDQ